MIKRYENVLELIDDAFKKYADAPAYTCAGHTLSYREIDELSDRFAAFLQNDLGLSPGDRVALQLPNILQFPVAMYGVIRAGLVVVNTNPLYTPREVEHQLKDSGAKLLVVFSHVAHNAAEIIQNTDVENVIVTDFGDMMPFPKRTLVNLVIKHVKKLVPAYSFKSKISFRSALKPSKPLKTHPVKAEDVLVLQYTGGTTGVSKGAMLSHHNLASNVWQSLSHLEFEETNEVFVCCLPLYHIYALNLHALAALSIGEHNVLIPNPRDLQAMVDALRPFKMTVFVGINTLFNALCRFEPFKELDFSQLKCTASGGMALTEDAARLWKDVTGGTISEGYGLTETCPVVCANPLDNIQQGTVGLPVPETSLKVIDEDGKELESGEVGELCVKGPQVMMGYWQKPEETANVLDAEGWLKTGDMAMIQGDGYVRIVDRKKDMIIVSGFNVYPNEIEDIICQHPDVVEAAAVGVADEGSGEVVKLFVVSANKELNRDEIYRFCRKNLTAYKVPKIIEFRDSLPKSNVGKILRKELRD